MKMILFMKTLDSVQCKYFIVGGFFSYYTKNWRKDCQIIFSIEGWGWIYENMILRSFPSGLNVDKTPFFSGS